MKSSGRKKMESKAIQLMPIDRLEGDPPGAGMVRRGIVCRLPTGD
jgi:hypothetical protein